MLAHVFTGQKKSRAQGGGVLAPPERWQEAAAGEQPGSAGQTITGEKKGRCCVRTWLYVPCGSGLGLPDPLTWGSSCVAQFMKNLG